MLVAKRDPFESGAPNHHSSHDFGAQPARPPLARAMSALQTFGTLLAIPLGIGSAYTMYHANFAPETTCQNLRASIVAMLDKGVDARTRHMLVRRDVEAFEKSCGSVDPDATAAFKSLLANDTASLKRPVAKPAGDKPEEVVRKAESKAEPKPDIGTIKTAEAAPAPREQLTDAAWLAAVRGALGPAESQAARPDAMALAAAPQLVMLQAPPPSEPRASLPPPVAAAPQPVIADAAAPDADHPVPPAPIPQPVAPAHEQSRLGSIIQQIPFVGQAIAK
jgi:hypothetical protein